MSLFKKKLPPIPTKTVTEVIGAELQTKEIDYKAEYDKLKKEQTKEIPQEAKELPKFEEKEEEAVNTNEEDIIKHYVNYVTLEPNQAETIKINLLFSILDELKKLNEKTE